MSLPQTSTPISVMLEAVLLVLPRAVELVLYGAGVRPAVLEVLSRTNMAAERSQRHFIKQSLMAVEAM